MVARHADRDPARHRIHDEAQAVDNARAPVHQVAEKTRAVALFMRDGKALVLRLDAIAKLGQQRFEFIAAAVEIADDVERPGVVASVGPKALAFNDRRIDLRLGTKLETIAEAFASPVVSGSGAATAHGCARRADRSRGPGVARCGPGRPAPAGRRRWRPAKAWNSLARRTSLARSSGRTLVASTTVRRRAASRLRTMNSSTSKASLVAA